MVDKGTASVTAHDIRFWNGSHISLNHLQTKKDAFKYSGRSTFHGMLFDEATQLEPELGSLLAQVRGSLQDLNTLGKKFGFLIF